MAQNYGLGRGLASLIPQKDEVGKQVPQPSKSEYAQKNQVTSNVDEKNKVIEVDVNDIVPNPHQPRVRFDEERLSDLENSIKSHGVIQPLIVSKNGDHYELIAGERRFQASKKAGLSKVPVIVRDVKEKEKLELAIVENIQRHDLDPIEEARAYERLVREFDMTQEEVAEKMGKSRSAVTNKIRLLELPVDIQKAMIEGIISEGHGKVLLSLTEAQKQRALFELILAKKLTVRQTESQVRKILKRKELPQSQEDPGLKMLENQMTEALGTRVRLTSKGKGGKIMIDYFSKDELNDILDKIVKEEEE